MLGSGFGVARAVIFYPPSFTDAFPACSRSFRACVSKTTGVQLKYLVWYTDRPIACLSFGPAAWRLAARDQHIGWSAPVRQQQRLAWVVNNDRFLTLPIKTVWVYPLRADFRAVLTHKA